MRFSQLMVDKDLERMVKDIQIASTRLTSIVNDFLEASRLEQGKIKINAQKTSVATVIEEVTKELDTIAVEKNVGLGFVTPTTEIPDITIDRDRLKQVLVNLVGNALKFTSAGSILLREEVKDNWLYIYVKDTGSGIPEKNRNLLFRKFQQAGDSIYARDTTQGTGLGLYICKLLTNAMGGEIKLEHSELGVGSEFSIHFPLDSV
jgi:signal transduction histidine kinase